MTTPSRKVLVIDDDATLQLLAKEYLSEAGFVVRVAGDGVQGEQFATKFSPDIVLLDLIMPTCDGYELCAKLKSNPNTADIPVVLMTGSRESDVIKRGLEAGATDFVTKPIDWEFLADRVNHVLKQEIVGKANGAGNGSTANKPDEELEEKLAQYESENSELKDLVRAANHKLVELTESSGPSSIISEDVAQPSVAEIHSQVSQIEQEWSDRLQHALAQASGRADQRIAEIQAQLDAKDHEISSLAEMLQEERKHAADEKESLLQQKQMEFESLLQTKIGATRRAHEQGLVGLQKAHDDEVNLIWQFVASATDEYRTALRRSQAAVAELQKLLLADATPESVFERMDVVTTLMVGNLRQLTLLHELARVESDEFEQAEHSRIALGKVVEQCVSDARTKCNRLDVEFTATVDPSVEVSADENRLVMALALLIEHTIRCIPMHGNIHVGVETETTGVTAVKIAQPEVFGDIESKIDCVTDAEGHRKHGADASMVGLSVAKAILARFGGRVDVSHVTGRGAMAEIRFSQEVKAGTSAKPVDQNFAEAV